MKQQKAAQKRDKSKDKVDLRGTNERLEDLKKLENMSK